jgi:hypothetical protein
VFPKISELRKHIQIIAQCSKRQAAKAATVCLKDPDYAVELLGIELYQDLFGDPTGEQAVNNVLKEQAA